MCVPTNACTISASSIIWIHTVLHGMNAKPSQNELANIAGSAMGGASLAGKSPVGRAGKDGKEGKIGRRHRRRQWDRHGKTGRHPLKIASNHIWDSVTLRGVTLMADSSIKTGEALWLAFFLLSQRGGQHSRSEYWNLAGSLKRCAYPRACFITQPDRCVCVWCL